MNQNNSSDASPGFNVDRLSLSQLDDRPSWTSDEVRSVVSNRWNFDVAAVTPLVSERDQNWTIRTESGELFVLKVANAADDPADIGLQQSMMMRLAASGLPVPQPVLTAEGDALIVRDGHIAWLINFLTGAVLATVVQPPEGLFVNIGQTVAKVTNALDGFDHRAAHRSMQWDVQHAERVLTAYMPHIPVTDERDLVENILATFRDRVRPRLENLELGVIHNDLNDHNLLIRDSGVSGVIDFGDAVHSIRINDLAIACAYAMLDRPDPLAVMQEIVSGYTNVRAIPEPEEAVLHDLIRTRLATSVSISTYQGRGNETDEYLKVSEAPAWRLIKQLDGAFR